MERVLADVDFDRREITIRRGKGAKGQALMLPEPVTTPLRSHLDDVQRLHAALSLSRIRTRRTSRRLQIPLSRGTIADVLDYLWTAGVRQQIHFLWRPVLPDPSDDLVLEVCPWALRPDRGG